GARVAAQVGVAVERRQRDGRAESRVCDGQVHGREDVVALADEARIRPDVDEYEQVPRPPARRARVALAGEPDPLAVVDSRRDLDPEGALLDEPPAAVAALARVVDDRARAVAPRAGVGPHELAERAPRDL